MLQHREMTGCQSLTGSFLMLMKRLHLETKRESLFRFCKGFAVRNDGLRVQSSGAPRGGGGDGGCSVCWTTLPSLVPSLLITWNKTNGFLLPKHLLQINTSKKKKQDLDSEFCKSECFAEEDVKKRRLLAPWMVVPPPPKCQFSSPAFGPICLHSRCSLMSLFAVAVVHLSLMTAVI